MAKGQKKQAQEKINKEIFENLCHIQCTRNEIAATFGVSKETLLRWCKETYGTDFETIFAEKREVGKQALRHKIFQAAMKGGKNGTGDTTMMIFLSKNYLGMSDKVEAQVSEKIEIVGEIDED